MIWLYSTASDSVFHVIDIILNSRCYKIFSLQLYVSVKGINGAGITSVSTSNGVYMSYLSQGLPPIGNVGVMDLVPGSVGDM